MKTDAVFVGDGSLLVQCAQAWRSAGHEVLAVASASDANLAWAGQQAIPAIRIEPGWEAALAGLPGFDYLFSVANLRMLPAGVLARARKLAINFHDALLPRYAGLNATCWALMAQERSHGVSWHEMTDRPDAGRIVRQAAFEISEQETALSLNAKCYEAGLASFTAIAQDLARGELALLAQNGERQYFGRHRRPPALGTLDFARPAMELAAMVRALDFGQYPNPLARAKVLAGDRLLAVRGAEPAGSRSGAAPGTVLSVQGDAVRVATADVDLLLTGVTDLQGRAPAGIASGDSLALPAAVGARLAQRSEAIARGEQHWTDVLHSAAAVELPYPRRTAPAAGAAALCLPLHAPARGATTLAAFHAWLAALTGQGSACVLYTDAPLAEQARELQPWLSPWVPVALRTDAATTTLQAVGAAESAVARSRAAGPIPRDLPARLGDRQSPLAAIARVAVSLHPCERPEGCEVLVRPDAGERSLELVLDGAAFDAETGLAMAGQLGAWLNAFAASDGPVSRVPLFGADEQRALDELNATQVAFDEQGAVHAAIAAQLARAPGQVAVSGGGGDSLTGAQLDEQSTALAQRLLARGVRPGDIVGLCLPRTPQLLVAVLGVFKAGAAYLPLDPDYPQERLQFMVEDSQAPLVLASGATAAALQLPAQRLLRIDEPAPAAQALPALPAADPRRPAYVIYTSGSTGKPKGVVVTHRNVMNFFAGMDERVPRRDGARWLAVTSLSFDISVLELCWTLARGIRVVLHADDATAAGRSTGFSLFYFASDENNEPRDRYRLLLEGARFADREGFDAVWTPERHFHAFGGLFPNASVTSAAIAAITTRVQIRAGSCVAPLHHPIRIAEDWAFVDNISQGRVGVAFASGWQPNDFVLMPQAFARRQDEMLDRIDTVRRLWRGEAVPFPGPKGEPVAIRTLPRPVQPELPMWITAAGNPKTFEQAGALGCRLLTHLLGQKVEDVAEKLALYRAAWLKAGHPGEGHVTLMLHTFVDPDEDRARETARGPMKQYLRSAVDLVRQAAWSFPTFVERASASGKSPLEIMESAPLSEQDMDALLDHAFERYYGTSALIGTPQRCLELVGRVQAAGVDEIACLIDFGIAPDAVLASLPHLKSVMEASHAARAAPRRVTVAEQVLQHGVTHLQCTPSMAAMLLADAPGRAALSKLEVLLVGGEALPLEMATQLRGHVAGALVNMYGPTETTVWSTTCALDRVQERVPLGRPIANTQLSIRTPWGAECPALVPGELCIAGDGVTDGYLHRPELTAERFVADAGQPGRRWYRTGDLVRRLPDGTIEFLGRMDHQVKIRGHRIELGEIESVLLRQDGVQQAVVVARTDSAGQHFLAGYVSARPGAALQAARLREAVAQVLPEIMVPQAVLVLPALPTTPNGKIDRKLLPDPRAGTVVRGGPAAAAPSAAPENALEKTIAAIWQDVLGLESVGTTENFFDLGGHSLLVVQVQRRLREATGQEVSITDMFRLPTIQALAAHLGGGAASAAVLQGQSRAQARRMLRNRTLTQS